MYDAANDEKWVMRQTGIMVAVPEIWGAHLRRPHQGRLLAEQGDGRLRRLDDGARSRSTTPRCPILADGIKWLGYLPKARVLWNLGYLR